MTAVSGFTGYKFTLSASRDKRPFGALATSGLAYIGGLPKITMALVTTGGDVFVDTRIRCLLS